MVWASQVGVILAALDDFDIRRAYLSICNEAATRQATGATNDGMYADGSVATQAIPTTA